MNFLLLHRSFNDVLHLTYPSVLGIDLDTSRIHCPICGRRMKMISPPLTKAVDLLYMCKRHPEQLWKVEQ